MSNPREGIEGLLNSSCRETGPWMGTLRQVAENDPKLARSFHACFWTADAPSSHWSMACWLAMCHRDFVHKGPLVTTLALARTGALAWRSGLLWVPKSFEERKWMDVGMSGLLEVLAPPSRMGLEVSLSDLKDALSGAARLGVWEGTEFQAQGWASLQGWSAWRSVVGSCLERVELAESADAAKKSEGPSRSL